MILRSAQIFVLGIALFAIAPFATQAQIVPQSSDIVLQYNNAAVEQQSRYNFIFTIDNDDTIYACEANRCPMDDFRDREKININLYKLPDGFTRPQTIPNQAILQQYLEEAEQQYRLEGIQTNLVATGNQRPYYVAKLATDGTAEIEFGLYTKPVDDGEVAEESGWPIWLIGILAISGIAILTALVILMRQRVHARRIQL